jgi:hypothetical protein
VGGYRRTVYEATVEVSRSRGQPWMHVADGLLMFDGSRRHLSLNGERLSESVSSALAEAADLNERSGVAELAFGDHKYRLTFNWRSLFIF